jgi:hypothetical protein
MANSTVRAHYTQDSPEDRSVEVWGGIVSARVSDLADELGEPTQEVVEALQDVSCLVDTAEQKRKERPRPDDPSLRSVALTTGQLDALRSELETEG